jgi:two-component system response regulator AtoC
MGCRILIVETDDSLRERLALALTEAGHEVQTAADGSGALTRFDETPIDVILAGAEVSAANETDLIARIRRRRPNISVITLLEKPEGESGAEALRRGLYDFLPRSASNPSLLAAVRRAEERERLHRQDRLHRRNLERLIDGRPIVAASAPMIEVLERMERIAEFKSAALLTGELGTGMEVLARAIHSQSARRHQPFVPLSCAILAEDRFAAELFGHARGAVSGADRARPGLIAEAHGGTLFLEEIGRLPLPLQEELLRVLHSEEVRRIGSDKPQPVDVRFVTATCLDLEAEASAGRFSADLLAHLNLARIDVPPLRERARDIPLLVDHFVAHHARTLARPVRGIAGDALERLVAYPWPGNVRELENVIERAVMLATGEQITQRDLPVDVLVPPRRTRGDPELSALALRPARKSLEADLIRQALRATEGNRTHAAQLLDISHRALLYKLKEYGIRD